MSQPSAYDQHHRSLARVLHARIYVDCEGRIFVVRGRAAHNKLSQALARIDCCPSAVEAPTPHELGVPSCDGELTLHVLNCISRALTRWRKKLTAEMQRKRAKRRKAKTLRREQQEIEQLTFRLTTLRELHAELARGRKSIGTPFFLDPVAERSLRALLETAQRIHPLAPLIAWQARVVHWLSGECATRRFLSATAGMLVEHSKSFQLERVHRFQQTVLVWKQRSKQERIRDLRAEMVLHIKRLPSAIVDEGRLSTRLRGRTFQEHCDVLLKNCSHLIIDDQRRCVQVSTALAALAAADGSAVAIPQRCFRVVAGQEDFARALRTIEKLAEQIGRPGYDSLLIAIDQLSESRETEFDQIRQLLKQGNSLADCIWACENFVLLGLPDSCLSIRAARCLSDSFTLRGCPLFTAALAPLVSRIQRKEQLAPIHAWLAWLGSVSPRAITPRLQKVLWAAFWQRYLPSVEQYGWFERLAPWLAAPRRTKDLNDFMPLLKRISAYQQFIGKNEGLPKSLRKLLDVHERRQREFEALRIRQAAGSLDRSAQARLQSLESSGAARPDAAKIRRTAEEVFLLLGIDALGIAIRKLAEEKCAAHLGDLVKNISPDQLFEFALWIGEMNESQCDLLRRVMKGHYRHGPEYKRHLAANQYWIHQALAGAIDIDPWFAAPSHVEAIGGRKMEINHVCDLHHVFLMGHYFNTCLSLCGLNQMSLLANAHDANKQVVFMFMENAAGRQHVVARQLIAISDDFKLLGYTCYVSSRIEKRIRPEVVTAMACYCGRLAAKCGIELADDGSPAQIGDHFWWDDGVCDWPADARTVWSEGVQKTETLALSAC